MTAPPEKSQPEQPQRALSPEAQFEQAAQNAHSLAVADADLFRQVFQYASDPTPAQFGHERANAAVAGIEQDRIASNPPAPSQYPHVATRAPHHPTTPNYPLHHPAQHLPPYTGNQHDLNPTSMITHPSQTSNSAPYWLPPQSTQLQSNHGIQNGNMHSNAQEHARVIPSSAIQQENMGTTRQYRLAPPEMTYPTTQLHQSAPTRPFSFASGLNDSPSVTPKITASASASPSTANMSSSTPASTTPGDTPSSNLMHKQHMSRKHTRVSDIEDPAICHVCFHMVVQKSSIKNHLVNVHGWNREDAREIDIYTKSELLAAGYEVPPNLKSKKIISNMEAAANPEINKVLSKRKYAITDNVGNSVARPVYGPPPKAGSVAPPPSNADINVVGTGTRRRYGLNLSPPGLVAPGKVLHSNKPFDASKGLPALGGVFTGVNRTATTPLISTREVATDTASSVVSKDTNKRVENNSAPVVPTKDTYEVANVSEAQSEQAVTLHRPELETVTKLGSGPTQTLPQSQPAPPVTQSASNGSCVSGNRPNPGLKAPPAPTSASKVVPWLNGVESRKHTAQELSAIAKTTLSLVPDDLKHRYGDHTGQMPGLLSRDLAARNAVISAVDYHEGTIAAASIQLELDKTKYQENSKDAEGTPSKRLKMSYGEIFVPKTYMSDERLANVDRDGAEGKAVKDTEPDMRIGDVRIDWMVSMTPDPKDLDMPDVQVWDDFECDAEEWAEEGSA